MGFSRQEYWSGCHFPLQCCRQILYQLSCEGRNTMTWLIPGHGEALSLFRGSVVSNSLRPHGLQHTRLPCPLPSPRVCWNPCPLHWWCHPTISSSVAPFSSCPHSFWGLVFRNPFRVFSNEEAWLLPDASGVPDVEWGHTISLEFGAEKGLLQGHRKRQVTRAPKPQIPQSASAKHF